MIYSKAWQYGVRILFELARLPAGERRSSERVAADTGVPGPFCGKLLSSLSESGLIDGRRGPGGGVMLGRPASTITLESIATALGELSSIEDCIVGLSDCSDEKPCPLHSIWSIHREILKKELFGRTLAELLEDDSKPVSVAPESRSPIESSGLRDELL